MYSFYYELSPFRHFRNNFLSWNSFEKTINTFLEKDA